MKKTLLILMLLALTVNGFAQEPQFVMERETLKEKVIGRMVKVFAKTYIATSNLKKFKEKNIRKIRKMDEAKFQRVYGKIYKEMMVDLPQSLKDNYGVAEHMTREKAIVQINAFTNKKKIYKLINAIPNKMIAKHFANHKDEFNKTMKGKKVDQLLDQILEDPAASNT